MGYLRKDSKYHGFCPKINDTMLKAFWAKVLFRVQYTINFHLYFFNLSSKFMD